MKYNHMRETKTQKSFRFSRIKTAPEITKDLEKPI